MATIDIPVGTSAFTTTTYTASSGDVFNIPAGMVGNIIIEGATDYTGNIPGDLTGRWTKKLTYIQFDNDFYVDSFSIGHGIARNSHPALAGPLRPTPANFAALMPRRHCA